MGDVAYLTLEEYAIYTPKDIGPGLVRPTIPPTTNFELKGQFPKYAKRITFLWERSQRYKQACRRVLEIVDYFNISRVTKDVVMLRMLLITFKYATKIQVKSLPPGSIIMSPGSIIMSDALKSKFLQQFNPPSMIAKLKAKIQNFQQMDGETLFEAWDRYRTLIKN